jgi:ABC-type antimicrobial peptide transport system permease subunit
VALGVGAVATIANCYKTSHDAILDEVVYRWLGSAHVTIHPLGAHWGRLDASMARGLAEIENVIHVTARLHRRVRLCREGETEDLVTRRWRWVDAIGIDPTTEEPFQSLPALEGEMLKPSETGAAVMERETAVAWGIGLGDTVSLATRREGPRMTLRVIGLFASQRLADFQAPRVYVPLSDLQALRKEPGAVTAIDVMLADASLDALAAAKEAIERSLARNTPPYSYRIETAASRQIALDEADRIMRLILGIVAFVAMLTSFFIIVTTQAIGLAQRRPQLGTMRCLGATRGQVTALLFFELVPLGVVGTVFGLLGGVVLTEIIASFSPELMIEVHYDRWGMALAAISGVVTTLLSAALLTLQVGRVTPLEALAPQARPARMALVFFSGAVGVSLLLIHHGMAVFSDPYRWVEPVFVFVGVGSLYLGYTLVTPVLVVAFGRPAARVFGRLLGLRARLAEEPLVRSPWRSTGACWVLMVGLSLIVYLAVQAKSVLAIWDFPARLPEAFVWTPKYVSGEVVERVQRAPGVGECSTLVDADCRIEKADAEGASSSSIVESLVKRLTRPVFVAGDPKRVLEMVKVTFVEGSFDEAMEKLERGGAVLIPRQTGRSKDLHLGDEIMVNVGGKSARFEVAGVVESPAMDMAVSAFQAESYMQFAAASALLGTASDLKEKFGLDIVSMFLFDLDLPETELPPDFDPQHLPDFGDEEAVADALLAWSPYLPSEQERLGAILTELAAWRGSGREAVLPDAARSELERFAQAIRKLAWSSSTERRGREENWYTFREWLVLLKVAQITGNPDAIVGSVSRLRRSLDVALRRAIGAITWLPSVLLVVAAVGIANLMMVSVHMRSRQIAMLRAVGAVKSQIVRLVLTEAVTLGALGSVMGVALGFHTAYSDQQISSRIADITFEFIVPMGTVAISVLITVGVCLLAGIGPARRAARNNIIDAMQTV